MNQTETITPPPSPKETCFVCKKPVEYILYTDWQARMSRLPFKLSESFKINLCFDRKAHNACGDILAEQHRQEMIALAKERYHEQVRDDIARFKERLNLPKDFTEKTFTTYRAESDNVEAVKLLKAWQIGDDFGFLIIGPSGTGKSHLGFSLINSYLDAVRDFQPTIIDPSTCIERPGIPHYAAAAEMLADIKKSPSWDISHHVLNSEFLLLDDIGAENITEWSREIFFRLFEHRLNKRLATVVTTNLSLNELKERLHERVVSRILGMCVPVQIKGTDKRRDIMSDRIKRLTERTKTNTLKEMPR